MMWAFAGITTLAAFFMLCHSTVLHDQHPEGATARTIAVRKERSQWLAGLAMLLFLGTAILIGLA